jgi:hypothetical protein
LGAVAAELVEAGVEIGAVAAEPALGQHGGDLGCSLSGAETLRIHDHARQSRRQRQRAQPLALLGNAAVGVERAEFA